MSQEVVLDQPLFLIHEVTASSVGSAYPRIYVDTARHSQMTLVEEYISSGSEPVMVNTVTEFVLAEVARITSVRLTLEGESVQHIGATGVRQATASRFESHCVSTVPEEVTMTCNKPEHIKDESWDQHLGWLDLVSNECKTNQLKRRRENPEQGGIAREH